MNNNIPQVMLGGGELIAAVGVIMAALWGLVLWFVKSGADAAKRREEKMGKAITEMELFQRQVLVGLVQSNQQALTTHSHALTENTKVTEALRLEIHQLRVESKERFRKTQAQGRRLDEGSSDINFGEG